jgi:UDP-2,3-diacylglucosamine pyrophosphatase LpxH
VEAKTHKLFIISDVHLNNGHEDINKNSRKKDRKLFEDFLSQINLEFKEDQKTTLILNGDIFDITGSWHNDEPPWKNKKYNPAQIEELMLDTIKTIFANNKDIIQQLINFLSHSHTQIVYVLGNHDRLIGEFSAVKKYIQAELTKSSDSNESEKVFFVDFYEDQKLGLYVEHGHRFDPFNISETNEPALGDVINIMIVNQSVNLIAKKLKENNFEEDLIDQIISSLSDIEYLRPLSLIPFWIESIANIYCNRQECNIRNQSIREIFRQVVLHIQNNPWVIHYLSIQLKLPRLFVKYGMQVMLRVSFLMPALSFIISKLLYRTHSNSFQSKMAYKIYKEKGSKLIVLGHTHIPSLKALSHDSYYCNTGSWTPVINLFKYSEPEYSYSDYLMAQSEFKRIDHRGYLKLEKDLTDTNSKLKFSLETMQAGWN